MKKLVINQEKVTNENAEQLIKLCPFQAITYDNNKLEITAACKNCGICVKKGPVGVIEQVDEKVEQINKNEWVGISVFIEHDGRKIHPVSFELIGKARELAKVVNHPVYAVLMCDDLKKYEEEILSYGVDELFVYEDKKLVHFNVETYTACMEDFINKKKPSVILYGGTLTGRSFAPRVAGRFRTGLTADCTILEMKKNTDLIQNRPAFGGNVMASIICPNTRPQMATVRYKIFTLPSKEKAHGQTIQMDMKKIKLDTNMQLLKVENKDTIIDISEAEVLVACGKAFKTKEDLQMAEELAELLGGQLAFTRPLIEAGLADSKKQIGLSGRTVAPQLLITLGISGAVQFTAGMSGSQVVFSINQDEKANIFDVSHYAIVGDVFIIVPELIKQIKAMKGLI